MFCFALGAVSFGCAKSEELSEPCSEPDQSKCGGEAGNEGEGGDGDNPDGANYQLCTATGGVGERTLHQCNGYLTSNIEFSVIGGNCAMLLGGAEACTETHYFGVGEEPYEMPAVMACCDAELTPEDEALKYCAADLVAQVCSSVSKRLEALIEEVDDIPNINLAIKSEVKRQAKNLLWHINENQQACFNALHQPDAPGVIGPVEWKVGNSEKWWAVRDFTVALDSAMVESVSLPDDGSELLACEDDNLNDNELFEERGPMSRVLAVDVYGLDDPAKVSIMGPRFPDIGQVQGSATAASQSVCAQPRCSSLEIDESERGLVLVDLDLYADGVTSVSMGEVVIEIDGLALRLYGAVQAQPSHGNDGDVYIIDPGAAHFLVTGSVGDMSGTRWTENLDPILLQASGPGWTIEGFSLVHTDGLGGTWEAYIPPTRWD